MRKKKNETINAGCTIKENKKINGLNEQIIEEQNVQQRYHKEFIKYQEQINKVKQLALLNNQAA